MAAVSLGKLLLKDVAYDSSKLFCSSIRAER